MKILFVSVLIWIWGCTAQAFSDADANTAFNAYNTAFYGTFSGGRAHYKLNKAGGVNYFWGQAEEIEGAIDAYERTGNPTYKTYITQLINGFSYDNGTSWAWNIYNDDIMWACIAYLRAYQNTGTTSFKDTAKSNFDMVYARAWDAALGGGLWWTTAKAEKNACVNGPGAIAAYLLFQTTGDPAYLAKAQAIYNWEKATLFNASSGAVYDNMNSAGVVNTWASTYNQGTFVGAADFLGDTASAALASTYTMNALGSPDASGYNIMIDYGSNNNNSGFNGIGIRWISKFMKKRNFQFAYLRWLQANANAAWNVRRTSDNLSWCQWHQQTPASSNLLSWDCISSVVALQVVPPDVRPQAPVFTVQPASQVAAAGNAVTLCAFATNGSVSYQWYHENTPLPGATGTNLVLVNVGASDAGNYWVVASNSIAGAYSSAAQITLFTVTNGIVAQDSASNYSGFSGNQGVGFGPWVLSTSGGGSYISGDTPKLFTIWNGTANAQSTASRSFNMPLPVGASFMVQLEMLTLDSSINRNGIWLQDSNGNVLFTYYHQGGDNANGHYTDARGSGTASGFAYDYGKLHNYKFTLNSATTYTFTDLTSAKSISGLISGAPISRVAFFRINGAAASNPSNGQDFKFNNLAIAIPVTSPSSQPITLTKRPQGWNLRFAVAPGYTHRVLRAADVTGPWTPIGTLIGPVSGVSEFIDTNGVTPQSFYRTVTP